MNKLSGIDCSHWQLDIDWNQVNVDFAIIKAGGGCPDPGQTVSQYLDKRFIRNRDAARAKGILRGYYWFTYPTINRPENEANAFCDAVSDLQDGEIMVLDIEGKLPADPVSWSLKFLDTVSNRMNGYKPLIYINKSEATSYKWDSVINANYGLYLAHYDFIPEFNDKTSWPFTAIKQYSDKGTVPGISVAVDLDIFNGTKEQFLKYGKTTPVSVPTPSPVVADPVPTPVVPSAPDPVVETVVPVTPVETVAPIAETEVVPPTVTDNSTVSSTLAQPVVYVKDSLEQVIIKDIMKVGVKTSEFWLGLAAALLTYLNSALGWKVPTDQVISVLGVVVAYIASRTILKSK